VLTIINERYTRELLSMEGCLQVLQPCNHHDTEEGKAKWVISDKRISTDTLAETVRYNILRTC
jgi:hypothetical protein